MREYATPLTGDAAAAVGPDTLSGNLTDDVVRNGERAR